MKLKSAEFFNGLTATFEQMTVLSQGSANANQDAVNRLSAVFEQINTLTYNSVAINQNIVTAELGSFVLFASFLDTFYLDDGTRPSDQIIFEFFKPLVDDASVAEEISNEVGKVLNDVSYFFEDQQMAFVKNTVDAITTSDPYFFEFAKALNDSAAASDNAALSTGRPVSDAAGVSDNLVMRRTLNKYDTANFSDEPSIGLGKPLLDAGTVLDAHTLAVAKVLSDQVASAEDHVLIFTKKAADEVVATIDLLQKNFGTSFADVTSLQEAHAIAFSKPLTELVASVGDQTFLFAKKVSTETVGVVDDDVLAFSKALLDNGYVSEAIDTLAVGKALTEAPTVSDSLDRKATAKTFSDNVNFTDDVDGQASILDDQEMQFSKIKTDVATITDVIKLVKIYTRVFAHTATATDSHKLNVNRVTSDSLGASESINKVTGKQIYDIPVARDSMTQSLGKAINADGALLGDTIDLRMSFSRDFSDSSVTSDSSQLQVGKSLLDTSSSSDSMNVATGKHLNDVPVVTEIIGKSLVKAPFLDSALLGDAAIVSPGKVLLSSTSSTDAGSIRSQGYSDFTYFAEDFVGASTTF